MNSIPPIGHGPQRFQGQPPPPEAQEIEALVAKVAAAVEVQDQAGASAALTEIGQKIDALLKQERSLPPVAQEVLDHLEKEYQFLVTHQDTLHPDQIVEFSLIASKLSDHLKI